MDRTIAPVSRFQLLPVNMDKSKLTDSDEAMLEPGEDDTGEDYGIDDVDDVYFKERANSCASQLTQSDLSRLGMLTAIGDPGKVHH